MSWGTHVLMSPITSKKVAPSAAEDLRPLRPSVLDCLKNILGQDGMDFDSTERLKVYALQLKASEMVLKLTAASPEAVATDLSVYVTEKDMLELEAMRVPKNATPEELMARG